LRNFAVKLFFLSREILLVTALRGESKRENGEILIFTLLSFDQ
jgi:hypothetical protein